MAVGRSLGAWIASVSRRLGNIPWRNISSEATERVLLVAKTACFVHVINNHVCGLALTHGPSMLPTLNPAGDVLAVERITVRWGSIGIGDVILVQSPENPRKIVAKRVLGLEGDSVTYLVDPAWGSRSQTVVIPKGHVWVQGDNIYNSTDSREFGPVPYGLIQGRVFCRVWPPEGFGTLGQGV